MVLIFLELVLGMSWNGGFSFLTLPCVVFALFWPGRILLATLLGDFENSFGPLVPVSLKDNGLVGPLFLYSDMMALCWLMPASGYLLMPANHALIAEETWLSQVDGHGYAGALLMWRMFVIVIKIRVTFGIDLFSGFHPRKCSHLSLKNVSLQGSSEFTASL